ncbi:MAG TPA: glycosyltransferase, partial [Herpetosiphonaceae bacterium]
MSDRGLVVMLAPFGLRPKATLSRRALPLAAELVRLGFRVHVLAPSDLWPADAGTTVEIDGVLIEHSPRFAGPLALIRSSLWMWRRARALRPALVHLFKPKGYGGIAAALLRLTPGARRIPLVVDTDDWEGRGGWNDRLPYPAPIKLLIDAQERGLPRLADAVTVASLTLAEQVRGFGAPAGRILYLPNGVALPGRQLPGRAEARRQLGLGDEPVVLLYTRFLEFALRDVVEFLLALAALRPGARLLVIGAGE